MPTVGQDKIKSNGETTLLKPLPTGEQIERLVRQGNRCRRISGVILGAGVGLVLGVVSQSINPWVMPGLSFYQPPFGPMTNALVCLIVGALMGLASAWPQENVLGVILAGLVGGLMVVAVTLTDPLFNWSRGPGVAFTLLALMLPFAAASAPIAASLRWAANKQEDAFRAGHFLWSRVTAPLVLVLAAMGVSLAMLYPPEARPALIHADAMVRAGRAASSLPALPAPLQTDSLSDFLQHARRPFTLEWTRKLDIYGSVVAPDADSSQQAAVVVRFDDGWSFVCVYLTPQAEPLCKGI